MGSNKDHLLYDKLFAGDKDLRNSTHSVIKFNGAEILVNTVGHPGVTLTFESRFDHGFEDVINNELPSRTTTKDPIQQDIDGLFNLNRDKVINCSGGFSRSVTYGVLELLEMGLNLHEATEFIRIQRTTPADKSGFHRRNAPQKAVMINYFLDCFTGLSLDADKAEAASIKNMSGYQRARYLAARVREARLQRDRYTYTNPNMSQEYGRIYNDRIKCLRYSLEFKKMSPEYIAKNLSLLAQLNPTDEDEMKEMEDFKQQHPEFYANMLLNLNVFWNNLYYYLSRDKRVEVLKHLSDKDIAQFSGLLIEAGVGTQEFAAFRSIIINVAVQEVRNYCVTYLESLRNDAPAEARQPIQRLLLALQSDCPQGMTQEKYSERCLTNLKNEFVRSKATPSPEARGFFSRVARWLKEFFKYISPEQAAFYDNCCKHFEKVKGIDIARAARGGFFDTRRHASMADQLREENEPRRLVIPCGEGRINFCCYTLRTQVSRYKKHILRVLTSRAPSGKS